MERYRHRAQAEAVRAIMDTLPQGIRRVLGHVHVVTDYDPAWLGLHFYTQSMGDDRLLSETAHCVWGIFQGHAPRDRRDTTVVLYGGDAGNSDVVLHELGHVLDERLNFTRPLMAPLDTYAARDCWEAFAVAFRAWCNDTTETDGWYRHNRQELLALDPGAVAFFDRIAIGED